MLRAITSRSENFGIGPGLGKLPNSLTNPTLCKMLIFCFLPLSFENLNSIKPGESNIFVSTKKLKYYGALQVKQKYQ